VPDFICVDPRCACLISCSQERQDPFELVADELSLLANRLRSMVVAEVSTKLVLPIQTYICTFPPRLLIAGWFSYYMSFSIMPKPVQMGISLCLQVPKLASAAGYLFKVGAEGKRFRPTVTLQPVVSILFFFAWLLPMVILFYNITIYICRFCC
jgi:geranyl diphosphate synthase